MSNIWHKLKKSTDFFVVFIILLAAVALYKYSSRPPKDSTNSQPAIENKSKSEPEIVKPPSIEKTNEVGISVATGSLPKYSPPPVAIQKSIVSTSVITMTDFEDPFCLFGKKDFVVLPDFYMKMFYRNRGLKVILPLGMAGCFKPEKSLSVIFYKYASSFKIPLTPFASASLRVITTIEYDNFDNALKAIDPADAISKSIYSAAKNLFNFEKSRKFVVLNMDRNSIDDYPKFWPDVPAFHPVAKFVQKSEGDFLMGNPNLIVIDSRTKKNKKHFPFKVKTRQIIFNSKNVNGQNFNLMELLNSKKKYFVNAKRETPFLILGSHQHDWGAINVANYLMGYGFRNLFIADPKSYGNILGAWKPPANNLNKISTEELKALLRLGDKPNLIDGRDPQYSGGIRGAIRVPIKTVSAKTSSEKARYAFDMDSIAPFLKPSKNKIVVYGRTDNDRFSIKLAKEISKIYKNNVYWLTGGYKAWSYNTKYKWEDEKLAPKPKNKTRRTAIPQRFKRGNPNSKGQFVPFDKSRYTGVVPPSKPLTKEELKEIRKKKKRKN